MSLKFGEKFTPHMLRVEYNEVFGWGEPKIIKYSKFCSEPSLISLHYGQAIYEGVKVFKKESVFVFRLKDHLLRLNQSAEQLCIPQINVDVIFNYIIELLKVDLEYIPDSSIGALYIRPFIFASEETLALKVSSSFYLYIILTSFRFDCWGPQDQYLSAWVNNEFGRSTKGGIGCAKTLSNYAITFKAREKSNYFNCNQVLWLDSVFLNRIEEFDTMNFFAITSDRIITPKLNGSILNGITRDTIIQLVKDLCIPVSEEEVSIEELISMISSNKIINIFGTGTAMGIVKFNRLVYNNMDYCIIDNEQDIMATIQKNMNEIYLGGNEKYINYLSEVR